MKPEVVVTKPAPRTGFSEGTESPIAQGVRSVTVRRARAWRSPGARPGEDSG